MDEAANFLGRLAPRGGALQAIVSFASLGSRSGWKAIVAETARWTMREPQFERVGLGDRISVSGRVDSERQSRRPNDLVLPYFGANLLMSVIELIALTARPSFVPRRRPFPRLIVEGLASALGRLLEDSDLRQRPGEDTTALHRTRLDIDVCAERFVATWTESVHAGER